MRTEGFKGALLSTLVIVLLMVPAISLLSVGHASAEGGGFWWNPAWGYRAPITITEQSGADLTDYQVKIFVSYDDDMLENFDDLRFVDSDGITELSCWMENYFPSENATVWVKVPSVPASENKTIWMYYGNPSAASAENGDAVFEFFDDFLGTSIDNNKWTVTGSPTLSNSIVSIPPGASIKSIASWSGVAYRHRAYHPAADVHMGAESTTAGYAYTRFRTLTDTNNLLFWTSNAYPYVASENETITTIGPGAFWANFDIIRKSSSSVVCLIEGIQKADHSTVYSEPSRYHLLSFSGGTLEADWVLVRKYVSPEPTVIIIRATIDISPDTLNLRSRGRWITAYIELPSGYSVENIDVSTVRLIVENDNVPAESRPTGIGDHDNDSTPDLMVKFSRSAVQALAEIGEVEMTVNGEVAGLPFEGSDIIRVIDFGVDTLYKARLGVDLNLDNGIGLTLRFYTYSGAFQAENVLWDGVTPAHVVFIENVPHPEGRLIQNVTFVLTDGDNVTPMASIVVGRSELFRRISSIMLRWPYASLKERSSLFREISGIMLMWPFAPP